MKNIWTNLKLALVIPLSLFIAGCNRHDAELARQISGVWKQELKSYSNTLTLSPNGTFVFARVTTTNQTTFTNAGSWRISGGRIILTATNAIGEHPLPLGKLFEAKILALNQNQWTFEMDGGRTNDFRR